MKHIVLVAVFLSFVCLSQSTVAQEKHTGMELHHECEAVANEHPTGIDAANGLYCMGYLQGVVEAFRQWEGMTDSVSKFTTLHTYPPGCIPDGVTAGEVVKVVIKYLNDNPNKLHERQYIVVIDALATAYPCPQKKAQ
jgi:hypothetical protein